MDLQPGWGKRLEEEILAQSSSVSAFCRTHGNFSRGTMGNLISEDRPFAYPTQQKFREWGLDVDYILTGQRFNQNDKNQATPASTQAAGPVAATPAEQQGTYLPPLAEIEQPVYPRQHTLTIPYYEQPVNAGSAVPLELVTPTLLVFDYLTHPRPSALFAVPVAGDSMLGAGIVHGSRLVCERVEADAARAMDRIVIASTADGTVVKRLTRSASGTVVLRSDNPVRTYADIPVDETVRIQAIVVKVLTDL